MEFDLTNIMTVLITAIFAPIMVNAVQAYVNRNKARVAVQQEQLRAEVEERRISTMEQELRRRLYSEIQEARDEYHKTLMELSDMRTENQLLTARLNSAHREYAELKSEHAVMREEIERTRGTAEHARDRQRRAGEVLSSEEATGDLATG